MPHEVPGQTFGADIIARIQTSISEGVETTRSGLSRQLCEWLDWRSVNGNLHEIDARKALLALEREGLIQLPAARIHPQQLREQGKQPPPQQAPVEVALHELGEVTLVAVSKREPELSRLWNSLLDAHHPLGKRPAVWRPAALSHPQRTAWLAGRAGLQRNSLASA